jgi:hypothetical protein
MSRGKFAMSSAADRNLLFGILALQMDFVTREQLIAAMFRVSRKLCEPVYVVRRLAIINTMRVFKAYDQLVAESVRVATRQNSDSRNTECRNSGEFSYTPIISRNLPNR